MGFNNYTYVGHYFKVKHKTVEKTEEKITYETESGEVFDEYKKFSSETGEATKTVVKEIKKQEVYKDLHDFVDFLDVDPDDYFGIWECPEYTDKPKGYNFIFPCGSGETHANLDEGECFEMIINPLAYDDFIDEHEEFIKDLKKVFEKVEVCFGAINYAI